MSAIEPRLSIHLAENLYTSDDEYDRIMAVIYFVNAMMESCLAREEEIPEDALQAYYCDYMQAQIDNGGMSQFVYNSRWNPALIAHLKKGLANIGAEAELKWVNDIDAALNEMGEELRQAYFESEYFGDNDVRDFLDAMEHEPEGADGDALRNRLHAWIGSWSDVTLVDGEQWGETVDKLAAAIPDLEQRRADAQAAEEAARSPEEWAIHHALKEAGRTLEHFNAFDMAEWEGRPAAAWHMTTTDGYCFALVFEDEILLFADHDEPPFHRMQRTTDTDHGPLS